MDNTISGLMRHKISGSVLIIVLILSLVLSMMVMVALESSVLQIKITQNYKNTILNFVDAEQSLQTLEDKILHNNMNHKEKCHVTKLQFVPETLSFDERQGINYYLLDIEHQGVNNAQTHLQSVVAIPHR